MPPGAGGAAVTAMADVVARPQPGGREVVRRGVERDVAEPVDAATTATTVAPTSRARQLQRDQRGRIQRRRPRRRAGRPPARCAATGAKRSRPWKVAETGSSRHGEAEISTASATPPKRSAAGMSSPLSGPTSSRSSSAVRSATARREAPTPGSTTATCTPGGA